MTTLTERVAALEAQLAPTAINDDVKYIVRTRPEVGRTPTVYGRRRLFGGRRILVPAQSHVVYVTTVIDARHYVSTIRAPEPVTFGTFTDTTVRKAQRQAADWIAKQRENERATRIYQAIVNGAEVPNVKLTEGDLR